MKTLLTILFLCVLMPLHAQTCATVQKMISVAKLKSSPESSGFPRNEAWSSAEPIQFCADWQGKNPDPQLQTEVRALYTADTLFLRFHANYRELYTYPGGPQRRDHLWDRDVAEVFLQAPQQSGRVYSEIEVSPNGDWIDLAIANGELSDLRSGMKNRVTIDKKAKVWTAEVALPLKALTPNFDPKQTWRGNFFRIEGPEPRRFYASWQPTNTPKANFHVPEVFAKIQFEE